MKHPRVFKEFTVKIFYFACLCLVSVFIFFSCVAGPNVMETSPKPEVSAIAGPMPEPSPDIAAINTPPPVTPLPVLAPVARPENVVLVIPTPERPARPSVPQYIMGRGLISPEDMAAFLLDANPGADRTFVENLARYYVEEAAIEGVNHDVAFAQMCLETGYLRFGNLVTPDQNNFAGLGATGPGQPGLRFSDPRIGVRAQIQHLKAYATDAPLNQDLVNPRFFFVRRGSSPAIRGLAGTWAEDPLYADKINNILERLYFFSFGN